MMAGEKGHATVVRELLQHGADANAHDNSGWTALHWASSNGRAEVMRELLKRHDANVNAQNNGGITPLMCACDKGHLMAATILIAAGADLALLNNSGESALRIAEQLVGDDEEEPTDSDDDEDDKDNKDDADDEDAKRERREAREKLHERHRLIVTTLRVHGAA
jgi:hypothetical protein